MIIMIQAINLGNNSEKPVTPEEIKDLDLSGASLQLIDPSPEELQVVSEKAQIPSEFSQDSKNQWLCRFAFRTGF